MVNRAKQSTCLDFNLISVSLPDRYKELSPNSIRATMHNFKMPVKQLYNEKEAAEVLGIDLPVLHAILDEHIFNDGTPRPESVEFTSSDLHMIAYWVEKTPMHNLVTMPMRD
jgi:hypothetical protein